MTTSKKTRRKRQKWQIGDYFLLTLDNGGFSIGQLIDEFPQALNSIICVFFDVKVKNEEEAQNKIKTLSNKNVISALVITRDSLDWGNWKIIYNCSPLLVEDFFDKEKLEAIVGVRIIGSGIVDDFLNAFYGLSPWNLYCEPDYFDKLLISPNKKPKNLIYKKKAFEYVQSIKTEKIPQKWKAGDYFLVPLLDGEFIIGQALGLIEEVNGFGKKLSIALCIFFDAKVKTEVEAIEKTKELSYENVIIAKLVKSEDLDFTAWKVFISGIPLAAEKYFNMKKLKQTVLGFPFVSGDIMVNVLNAFYCLAPWDLYEGDYFDKFLVSLDKKPKNLLYKKDFEE